MYDLVRFNGFAGINTDILPSRVPPEDESLYLRDAENVIVEDGYVKKIPGYKNFNNITTQQGQADFREVLGNPIYEKWDDTKYFLTVCPKNIYKLSADNDAWEEISKDAAATALAGSNKGVFSWVNSDNKFVFVLSDDGNGTIHYWEGGANDYKDLVDPSTLGARYLMEFKGSLFLLRVIESGVEDFQKIMWSSPFVIDTFPPANSLTLDSEGKILGGKQMGNEIMVYFQNEIQRVYWVDSTIGYGSEPLTQGNGLIASRTLTGTKDIHFWLSQNGVMRLSPGDFPRSISDQKFNRLILDTIDPVYKYKSVAQYYPHSNMLYLSYPSSGNSENNTQLIYDDRAGELVSKKTTNIPFSSYGIYEKDLSSLPDDQRLSFGLSIIPIFGTSDGYIKEQLINRYQDDNVDYTSSFRLMPTKFKWPSHYKRVLQCDILADKKSDDDIDFVLEVANEINDTWDIQITLAGDGNQGVRRYTFKNDVDIVGKEFNIRLKDDNNPFGWELHEVILRGYASTVN